MDPEHKTSTPARLFTLARPYAAQVVLALLTFGAAGATVLALGRGVRLLIDQGVRRGTSTSLSTVALELLLLVGVYGAAAFGRAYLANYLSERMVLDLRKRVYGRLLEHAPAFFEIRSPNLIWSTLNADAALVQSMISALVTVARNLLIVLGGLVAMLTTSLILSVYVLLLSPAITYAILRLGRWVGTLSDAAQGLSAKANAGALETLDAVRVVKAFGQEGSAAAKLDGLSEAAFVRANQRNVAEGVLNGVSIWMIFGAAVVLVWIGGDQVLRGAVSEGAMSAFLFFSVMVASSAATLSDGWSRVRKGVVAANRIFALLDAPVEIRAPPAPRTLRTPLEGSVSFEDVSFSYPLRPDVVALKDFSWAIEPGMTVALVGHSGAGKSTLFQLLLRFYDPVHGAVRVDGVDARELCPSHLRSYISIVPQEPTLFEGTVADNIRFGRPEASQREVEAAAEAAFVTHFAHSLPNGLLTPVGFRGSQLSGGQRQQIAMARAILRNSQILLLDEATNALDAESEHMIQQALGGLTKSQTTLVIAHRLATVRQADCILVLDHGCMVAHGTHEQLVEQGGVYANFARLQLRGVLSSG